MDYRDNKLDEMFYARFGNKWYQKLRRKFYYTEAENSFMIPLLWGYTEVRPKWEVRIMK